MNKIPALKSFNRIPAILVVDDLPENLQVIGNIFSNTGYRISIASNGTRALDIIEDISPDLILLDILMPGMDGFEVCKKIKENEKTRQIPILFLTSLDESEGLVKGFETGAVDYIVKPFDAEELIARVNTHLELKFARENLQKYIEEIDRKNEELELLNTQKDKFLSIIAHDLRNHFNNIIGISGLMPKAVELSDFEKLKQMADMVHSTALDTEKLLTNLLDWASSHSGKFSFEPEKLNVSDIFNSTIEQVRNIALAKNITINSSVGEELYVFADKNMLNMILRNLLTNAIKFSFKYSIINLKAIIESDKIEISVSDNGTGMTNENKNKLFKFGKNPSIKGTANEKGTGLGLILCKEFIEKQNGKIWVESEPGRGSTFKITLPLEAKA